MMVSSFLINSITSSPLFIAWLFYLSQFKTPPHLCVTKYPAADYPGNITLVTLLPLSVKPPCLPNFFLDPFLTRNSSISPRWCPPPPPPPPPFFYLFRSAVLSLPFFVHKKLSQASSTIYPDVHWLFPRHPAERPLFSDNFLLPFGIKRTGVVSCTSSRLRFMGFLRCPPHPEALVRRYSTGKILIFVLPIAPRIIFGLCNY